MVGVLVNNSGHMTKTYTRELLSSTRELGIIYAEGLVKNKKYIQTCGLLQSLNSSQCNQTT